MQASNEGRLVSAIVLNYNGTQWIDKCLESLRGQTHKKLEIIVVDNDSRDDSPERVRRHGVRLVAMPVNVGFSRGNNAGAAEAMGDYILFVNSDMWFAPDFVEKLVKVLDENHKVFCADAKQLSYDGLELRHCGTVLKRTRFFKGRFTPFHDVVPVPQKEDRCLVANGCGSSMLVRRTVFKSLGGFDEEFFIDWEDVDLCWRAWMLGWPTLYEAKSISYHEVGASFAVRSKMSRLRRISGRLNHVRFIAKTMPVRVIMATGLQELMMLGWFTCQGKFALATAEAMVLLRFLCEARRITKKRRYVGSCKIWSSAEIIRILERQDTTLTR